MGRKGLHCPADSSALKVDIRQESDMPKRISDVSLPCLCDTGKPSMHRGNGACGGDEHLRNSDVFAWRFNLPVDPDDERIARSKPSGA